MFIYHLPLTWTHALNVLVQFAFDYALVSLCSWNALAYLIMSSFFAGSLHPCAGHFIAEHYVFERSKSRASPNISEKWKSLNSRNTETGIEDIPLPETFSYYGALNTLTYNVGLHNEHHDFPAIPWTRLPVLNRIAREFYEDLPFHKSWVGVMWQFVWDEDVSLWCRVKRKEGGRKVGTWRTEDLGANEGASVPGVR
jgi:sphingolipid delta-4 desaturase